ncbi:trypsin-like peptidase domain-containing protein [Planococcus sp. CAU13]|uniref:trypsin-like peptidase domain-containing protein n=1 Tax=Planococcus sp. CAU13 TaxID=1541197 RepID=UPI00052FE639|nr:trypsin-like peptidase domain-containing protein [Planococcus sp. CAU13]
MFCRNCGARIDSEAKFCNGCGVRTGKNAPKISRIAVGVISILLLAGGGFGIQQYLTNEAPPEKPVIHESVAENRPVTNDKKGIIKASQEKVYTILTDSGIGSGFLFTSNGMVVTNAHVVAGFTDVMVRNNAGVEEHGRVIGISDVEDIAVIEVAAYKGQKPLPVEMEVTDVGSEVIALGSPNGFENSASIGYLTGVDRDISFDFEYEGVYQIDAQIAPGSSGGPLLDAETGKVIGINSLLYNDGNAIGFSIPLYSIHDSLISWIENPMSASAVASVFGVYETYDYFDWLEDYDYEDETVFYYDTEPVYEEEELVVSDEYYEDWSYDDEVYEEEYYEDWSFDEDVIYGFDEYSLWAFVENYRNYYEIALAYEDFSYVSDMLLYDSEIYHGIADYIYEISGQGMVFDFTEQSFLGAEIYDTYALVHTYESFDFMNAAGEWTWEERSKTYTVVVDEYGYYVISDIVND